MEPAHMSGIPDGWMQDSSGRLIRRESVKPEHILEDRLVRELHEQASSLRTALIALRDQAFDEVDAYLDVLAQEYGQMRGARAGAKGNITLSSYDGSLRVLVAVSDTIAFGPELTVAKQLLDKCLTRWSEGANAHIRTLVLDAFNVGQQGKLQVDRILGLRRLAIDDPEWLRAMEAISNAVRTDRSKRYVRFYHRTSQDMPYVQLPLDIARV
ncbi:Hypothetical protein GbCGDNIH2_7297 [Granulibacter bethesdensis]|nr:Hypothetical protein GbCGDNIH2_7297 [Granulibacter bethesdensis]